MPQNLGSIYLGETFSSFVNVQNDSQQTVRDVVLKTDLQTSSQRMPLSNPTGQAMVSKLVPGWSSKCSPRNRAWLIFHINARLSYINNWPIGYYIVSKFMTGLGLEPRAQGWESRSLITWLLGQCQICVSGDNISEVITHEVKELGGQLLVCTVSYINTSGEKQMFRKYYKFQVRYAA